MQLNYVKPWHATDLRIRPGPEKVKEMVREYGIWMLNWLRLVRKGLISPNGLQVMANKNQLLANYVKKAENSSWLAK